jgi:hypothetical protein
MTRVNVYAAPEESGYGEKPELLGWFDPEKAEEFEEDRDWDGSNFISAATGSQFAHQSLYRTAGGRWVLHEWSQWQGSLPSWQFLADSRAREWLLENKRDEAAERFFGEVEEEKGPGRPEIGPAINVRLGNLLTAVDAYAEANGIKRAEAVRRLVAAGLVAAGELGDKLGRIESGAEL